MTMTIDALSMIVVDVLGKFVVDNGATLIKEAGQAAAQAASNLFELVMKRLKANSADARNAERFEGNPEGYQVPVADAIAEQAKSDPDFAAQLSVLIREYRKAASSNSGSNIETGSGAVATQGSFAAGEGGVVVRGNVKGGIKISNTQNGYSAGGV
jgi:hypothetical protein